MRCLTLPAFALTLVILGGCSVFGTNKNALDEVPEDLKVCFDQLVPKPQQARLTQADTFALIKALKRSEMEKSLCGKRLLAWIEARG